MKLRLICTHRMFRLLLVIEYCFDTFTDRLTQPHIYFHFVRQ